MAHKCELFQVLPRLSYRERGAIIIFILILGVSAFIALENPWTVAFIVSATVNLVILLYFLGAYERAPAADLPRRRRLKLVICILSSTLIFSFSYQVSKIVPFPFAVIIWSTSGIVTVTGYFLLVHHDDGVPMPRRYE
ncbi:unnamed protein product [Spirodela intermedia]|uniref:Uncharacterized protein n=1 Tax=Spirodela intermedia TaxID=51605 RepID=A0A7I8KJ04_SPIIN|nr:unnamed protein product [Spirodela intermedia]